MAGVCNKCGKEVPPENDAAMVEAYMAGNKAIILLSVHRHFLPTADCEGSPSRAQYIEGQPMDSRGYPYVAEWEPRFRKAYADLLADVAAGKFNS